MMGLIETKRSILALIREAEEIVHQCGKTLDEMDDYLSEFLTAKGVVVSPFKVETAYSRTIIPFGVSDQREYETLIEEPLTKAIVKLLVKDKHIKIKETITESGNVYTASLSYLGEGGEKE